MQNERKKHSLSAHEVRAIAADALVDPRTLIKALNGANVRPMVLVRIVNALHANGLDELLYAAAIEEAK